MGCGWKELHALSLQSLVLSIHFIHGAKDTVYPPEELALSPHCGGPEWRHICWFPGIIGEKRNRSDRSTRVRMQQANMVNPKSPDWLIVSTDMHLDYEYDC